jgi:hypothetical protein
MVSYYWDLATNGIDKEWVVMYTPYHRWFLFMEPNECLMFVPGNYQEMMEDYG